MSYEERIRRRKSYQLWSDMARFLKGRPRVSRILWRLYFLLDEKCAFGSQMHASYAYESLQLFCRDNRLDRRYCYGP